MLRQIAHSESVKHTVDLVTIPSGLAAALAHYMDLINGVMTFLVLFTSFVWGVYRIIEMHRKLKEKGIE